MVKKEDTGGVKGRDFQPDLQPGKTFIQAEEKPECPFVCKTTLSEEKHRLMLPTALLLRGGTLGEDAGEVSSVLRLVLFIQSVLG